MDSDRFDAFAKRLSALSTRRRGLRVLLAGIAAVSFAAGGSDEAAACRRRGQICRKHGQCCSGGCGHIRRRRVKTRNGKVRRKRFGTCGCSGTGERCKIAKDCCDERDVCGANNCVENSVCCRPAGLPCEDDCECCGSLVCSDGACAIDLCSPSDVVCAENDFETCCPAGSSCTQFGCVTDAPGACPAEADSCVRELVFCGEPRRLDCACYQDLAGTSFCSSGFSCEPRCSSDTECEDELRPGQRCIRCPAATCGHSDGVCASPCLTPP